MKYWYLEVPAIKDNFCILQLIEAPRNKYLMKSSIYNYGSYKNCDLQVHLMQQAVLACDL